VNVAVREVQPLGNSGTVGKLVHSLQGDCEIFVGSKQPELLTKPTNQAD